MPNQCKSSIPQSCDFIHLHNKPSYHQKVGHHSIGVFNPPAPSLSQLTLQTGKVINEVQFQYLKKYFQSLTVQTSPLTCLHVAEVVRLSKISVYKKDAQFLQFYKNQNEDKRPSPWTRSRWSTQNDSNFLIITTKIYQIANSTAWIQTGYKRTILLLSAIIFDTDCVLILCYSLWRNEILVFFY